MLVHEFLLRSLKLEVTMFTRSMVIKSPMPAELKVAPLSRLLHLLHSGELKIAQFLEWTIAEVEAVHQVANVITHRFFEEAMAEAKRWDEIKEKNGEVLPPLAGLPMSIKGTFAVEGAPWVVGSVYRRGVSASFTDPGVERLLQAGALRLCLTNTPEAAFWIETYNKVYGLTRNPHNPECSAGGSSGGEAALVGSRAIPFGLGSDTGGSIRIPAAFCGACGLKPTPFSIPNEGHFPMPPRRLRYLMCSGPITRYAEDIPILVRHLYEPDLLERFETLIHTPLKDIELFIYLHLPGGEVVEEVRDAVEQAGEVAASLGVKLKPFYPPSLKDAFVYCICGLAEGEEIVMPRILKGKEKMNLTVELLRWFLGISPHTLPPLTLAVLESLIKGKFSSWVEKRNQERLRLREIIIGELGPNGLILGPVFPRPAPRHFQPLKRPWEWAYAGIYNVFGFPALALPWGKNGAGLPLSVQIAGPPGSDGLIVRLAIALERALRGPV